MLTWMLSILFLLLATTLHAGGRREGSLDKADQLIARRLYNEAIMELTSLIKRDPRFFDDAQKRLQRIVRLREEYNQTAAELLDILVNDPTNDERKLAMIRRLEELDAAPNRSAREFLIKTKETAQFTYNRAVFERIMAEGRALIDQEAWIAAALKYTEGFTLYRDEFYAAGYEGAVVARVEGHLEGVDREIAAISRSLNDLLAALEAFEKACAFSPEALPDGRIVGAARENFESVFLEFARARNASALAGRSLENEFLLLQGANPSLTDSSFLPFAFRFILGRKTEVRPEGILGAMDTLLIKVLNRGERAISALVEEEYRRSAALADQDSARATAAFAALNGTAQTAMSVIGLWSAVAGSESLPVLTAFGRSVIAGKSPLFIRYQQLARAALYEEEATRLKLRLDPALAAITGYPALFDPALSEGVELLRERWNSDRSALLSIVGDIDAQIAVLSGDESRALDFQSRELVGLEVPAYYQRVRSLLDALRDRALAGERDIAWTLYINRNGQLVQEAAPLAAELDRAEELIEGKAEDGNTSVPTLLRYPDRALESLGVHAGLLSGVISRNRELLASGGREPEYVREDGRIVEILGEVNERLLDLAALERRNAALGARARERIGLADNARREGDRLYAEARSALGRNAFDIARDRLNRATERYDYSLSIQESAALRAQRDSRLLSLSNDITQAENELVIRDVRRLLTQARSLYFAGTFERAEETLVQADLRWKTTNIEDEPEIVYWLGLVRGALSVRSGRSIPVTAPLYPEMSQLLSFARTAWEEGRALLENRRRVDALARFAEAERFIREVQIVFPLNQEASLLLLRIEQLRDQEVFAETFRTRVNSALAKEPSAPQEAYTEIQDLYEINPRYAGLRSALESIEIRLGLRLPPPDRAALARADQLVRDARRIVDGNVRAQFPVALEQLNEALRLNPSSEAAANLKVRIQTDAGGTANIVLSYEAQQEYRRAVAELQKGNAIVANAIVERLLQNPQNRNSPQIIELQKRIQSRLR